MERLTGQTNGLLDRIEGDHALGESVNNGEERTTTSREVVDSGRTAGGIKVFDIKDPNEPNRKRARLNVRW